MKKIISIILLSMVVASQNVFATSFDELSEFDIYIEQHRTQMNWGGGLTLSGLLFSSTGTVLVGYGLTLHNTNQNNDRRAYIISGYSFVGIGLLFAVIGVPLWFFSHKDYLETLNMRQQYFMLSYE